MADPVRAVFVANPGLETKRWSEQLVQVERFAERGQVGEARARARALRADLQAALSSAAEGERRQLEPLLHFLTQRLEELDRSFRAELEDVGERGQRFHDREQANIHRSLPRGLP